MKIINIGEPEIIMSNPDSKHNYFAWPTIARLQNGKIAVGASGYRLAHVCPFGKACISYSEDNGKTYTRPAPVIDTIMDDRDVGLCTFGKSGLILTSFTHTVSKKFLIETMSQGLEQCVKSEEEKKYVLSYLDTISDEEEEEYLATEFKISNDYGVSFGELHKSPVTSPHGPVELKDGTILWVGENYINKRIEAHKIFPDGTMEKIGQIGQIIENGKTFGVCEPYALQIADGTIICHIRTIDDFSLFQAVSKDNGRTWTEPERILPPFGGAPSFMLEHSSGKLICVYGYRGEPYGIRAMFSMDGGITWDKDYVIYQTLSSSDIGYPSIIELEDKSILMVFYTKDEDSGQTIIMQQKWRFEE